MRERERNLREAEGKVRVWHESRVSWEPCLPGSSCL